MRKGIVIALTILMAVAFSLGAQTGRGVLDQRTVDRGRSADDAVSRAQGSLPSPW